MERQRLAELDLSLSLLQEVP